MEKKVFCYIIFLYRDISKYWITNIKSYEIAKYIYPLQIHISIEQYTISIYFNSNNNDRITHVIGLWS
jgi:hypothetical protein